MVLEKSHFKVNLCFSFANSSLTSFTVVVSHVTSHVSALKMQGGVRGDFSACVESTSFAIYSQELVTTFLVRKAFPSNLPNPPRGVARACLYSAGGLLAALWLPVDTTDRLSLGHQLSWWSCSGVIPWSCGKLELAGRLFSCKETVKILVTYAIQRYGR